MNKDNVLLNMFKGVIVNKSFEEKQKSFEKYHRLIEMINNFLQNINEKYKNNDKKMFEFNFTDDNKCISIKCYDYNNETNSKYGSGKEIFVYDLHNKTNKITNYDLLSQYKDFFLESDEFFSQEDKNILDIVDKCKESGFEGIKICKNNKKYEIYVDTNIKDSSGLFSGVQHIFSLDVEE